MPSPATAASDRDGADATRGIVLVLVASLLLACMDAGSKTLAETYPIVQILWVRFTILAGLAWALARRTVPVGALRTRRPWLQLLRSIILVTEIGLFIYGITVLSLAEAHAIFAIMPLLVTALSVPLLGERVGIRRWTAVAIAFVGVLIILRPGMGVMQPMSIVPLICAVMFALYQVLTRIVGRDDGPAVTLFYTAVIGGIGLTVIGPFFWIWPTAWDWGLFVLVALLGAAGHYMLIAALRLTPASTLQPFNYTIMVWAALVGYVVFDSLPDLATVTGALIIAGSGLYAFQRQKRREVEARAAEAGADANL